MRRVSVAKMIAAYRELLKSDLSATLVRLDDDADPTEVEVEELMHRPGRFQLTRVREDGSTEVYAEASSLTTVKPGTELTRDQAIARDIMKSGERLTQAHTQQEQRIEWFWQRYQESQTEIGKLRDELRAKDEQIARLCIEVESRGDEFVELLKEGVLLFKDYSFTGELKKRLNRIAPQLTVETMKEIAQIINSPDFKFSPTEPKEN